MSQERESWGNHCEFFLSSLGLAVGLGNVWRFPYVCYTNGGGSFLIPYIVMLIFVGLPAFFLELSLGQYSRVGANKVFGRMVPAFNGLGYAMIVVRFFVNIYYVVITAWSLYYLAIGFQKTLPWGACDKEWNTINCYSKQYADRCHEQLQNNMTTWFNKTCVTFEQYCIAKDYPNGYDEDIDSCLDGSGNSTLFKYVIGNNSVSPAEDYFNGQVLGLTKNELNERYTWKDYGSLQGHLVGCLAASWVLICLTLIKGIQSYGKIAYVITLSPYFVLTILLVYTAGWLEGAGDGVKFLFNPDWGMLTDVNIWARAASQILFSLSVAFGSQLVLSSYNDFRNNSQRDSIIVGICNSLTSLYAGVVVFLILGFLAKQTGSEVDQVVKGGISLAFVSYPSAVLAMEVSPLWSFLFFFMLINLALSSICGGVQTFLAFVLDEKPSLTKYKSWIVVGLCVLFFIAGLPMCTNGGILLFTVFDKRCTSSLLFICILEIIHVGWAYGTDKFFDNLAEMNMELGKPVRIIWALLWKIITPAILAFITVLAWIKHEPMSYDDYEYPESIEALGWIMELLPLFIVIFYPIIPFYKAWKEGFRGKELYDELFKPTEKWYSAQMERRQAELQEKEASKYVHHNLGYDDDEKMQGARELERKRYREEPPPSYDDFDKKGEDSVDDANDKIQKANMDEIESLPEAKENGAIDKIKKADLEEIESLPEAQEIDGPMEFENVNDENTKSEPIEPIVVVEEHQENEKL